MRKLRWTISGLWLCGLLVAARADTFALADGSSLTGDIVRFTDTGLLLHAPDDSYTNVAWPRLSQDALKQLAANPKIKPFVEPFIEIQESQRPKKPAVNVGEVTRLELPPKQSLIGALFSSSVGLLALLLVYAASIYAGFEVAIFRARPIGLGVGAGAVLPFLGPVILLSMPTVVEPEAVQAESVTASEEQSFSVPGMAAKEEIQIVASSWQGPGAAPGTPSAAPPAQVFQRGQFTFNRRFFETKFPGFFGVVRRDVDKDMALVVKTMRGEFVVQRIVRIAQDDVHFQIVKGEASFEEMVPFAEIQEIQLKHKDA
jgi:hypothetical protein